MKPPSAPLSIALLVARFLAGAPLVLAGVVKATGDPLAFSLSLDSFKLFPSAIHLPIAYFLPWFEITLGMALLFGVWVRQSAFLTAGLLITFTLALISVLARGLDVDCGCFGGLFGDSKVGWHSIARNAIFIAAAVLPAIFGGGRFLNLTPEYTTEESAQDK